MTEYRYDTQLLIEGTDLDEDAILITLWITWRVILFWP